MSEHYGRRHLPNVLKFEAVLAVGPAFVADVLVLGQVELVEVLREVLDHLKCNYKIQSPMWLLKECELGAF